MREIKFRAWKQSQNKMLSWNEVCETGKLEDILNGVWLQPMQFTGMHDKNGEEVYEGDIWERVGFIAVVEWAYASWHLQYTNNSKSIQYPNFHSNIGDGKVIGNIYENRDLLND